MDIFSTFLNLSCLTVQCILQLRFMSRLTGKHLDQKHFAIYFLLLCIGSLGIGSLAAGAPPLNDILSTALTIAGSLLILYIMIHVSYRVPSSASFAAAVLAVHIPQLSFGIINAAESMLFPAWIGSPMLYPLVLLASAAAYTLCGLCFHIILKFLSLGTASHASDIALLLLPSLFFFAAETYILHAFYHGPVSELDAYGKHLTLLFIQVLELAALLCTVYAYHRLCRSFEAQSALDSLTQAANAQKAYIAEAQLRYEQTRAFRHDIKNHLTVLGGLLNNGKIKEGCAYLEKLEIISSALSLPYRTGRPAVDILLAEKLTLAEANGIAVEVSLLLPEHCGMDSLDLCVIFANALDNAIQACQSAPDKKSIRITGERQGDFYLLAFENSCAAGPLPPSGTGLANIQTIAGKYHGAMLAEKSGGWFSLHVLVNIS